MIHRQEVEDACFNFSQSTGMRVTPQLVELIRALLNAALYDAPISTIPYWTRERDIVKSLDDQVTGVLKEVAESQHLEGQISAVDFLRWLVPEWREQIRSIHALRFVFDKK
jgi:hypothetical protein